MFIFLAVLTGELAIGSTLGLIFAKRLPRLFPAAVIAFVLYVGVSVYFASLATQYPGPESKYASDPHAQWMRENITAPTTWLWLLGPVVSAMFVTYWRSARQKLKSNKAAIEQAAYSSLISLFFLPLWLIGAAIHGANVAGTWL